MQPDGIESFSTAEIGWVFRYNLDVSAPLSYPPTPRPSRNVKHSQRDCDIEALGSSITYLGSDAHSWVLFANFAVEVFDLRQNISDLARMP